MSLRLSVHNVALPFGDDPARLGAAADRFLAALDRRPVLLGLGEPTHGVEAFPRLRNELLAHLVERHGFRSLAIESDCLAGAVVNDHVTTGAGDLDEVLATGFSHNFGASPANRELVVWLREHNAGRDPGERVRFYGFDAPMEMVAAQSPRASLLAARSYLAAHLGEDRVPHDAGTLAGLLGDDADWSEPEAIMNPARSVGNTPRARELRLAADDLVALFEAQAPGLRHADSDAGFERAYTSARTARGLLRYHAAMASAAPDRVAVLGQLRDAMMADNLLAVARAEADRGPCLVFAHNAHLQRCSARLRFGEIDARWWSAGAIVASAVRDRYAFIAADFGDLEGGGPPPQEDTLHAVLSEATADRALFPGKELAAALETHPGLRERVTDDPRYVPFDPGRLDAADAVAFIRSVPGWEGAIFANVPG
ncbi:erythromycin esterase family protein [Actinomadura kijaniata]|uniref:erythromycin esterase family protein n=1 Tax=Actinomadura kijaniata TaxID=46161 RepID=UPI0008312F7B|nr:erythromycin esterase family protein [Actinomadura kijaniata]